MIIDSHTHAWARWPYQPAVPDESTRGSVEHLLYEMDLNGVSEALIVSANIDKNPENNDYVAEAVRVHPGRLHQLADVDSSWLPEHHTRGAARRLAAIADRLPIKGLTHYVFDANDGWLASDEGIAFFKVASDLKLIASIRATPAWAADIGRIADLYPDLVMMLHHMAEIRVSGPYARAGLDLVKPLVSRPNIYIKLSGFHYAADEGWEYPHSNAVWVAEELYQHFGPRRLCWGSDFPALSRSMTYRQALEIVRKHCGFISSSDFQLILGGNLKGLLAGARR
jgi:L-fuconolactonase